MAIAGIMAGVTGTFIGMGTPEIRNIRFKDVPGGGIGAYRPATALKPESREKGPGKTNSPGMTRKRETLSRVITGIRGRITGPLGPLQAVPVELVALPKPGEPERAGIRILSGRNGEFAFRNIPMDPKESVLRIQAPGYGISVVPLGRPANHGFLEIKLDYGRWVPGKAESMDGRPIRSGKVWVGLELPGRGGGKILWTRCGTTRRDGEFVARDLPTGKQVLVLVDHEAFSPAPPRKVVVDKNGRVPTLRFFLRRGKEISGVARTGSGRPAMNFLISWEKQLWGGFIARRFTITGEGGKFTLKGIPLGCRSKYLFVKSPEGIRRKAFLKRPTRNGKPLLLLPF